ncbi:MAG TPA: pantoate--beta-alanine ligase [Bacteroidia bacterium]|nr:pantoate--beta-alanine ligase [Bacteroidia bacterium]
METVTKRHLLLDTLNRLRSEGKSVGFVPTMGALHFGHIALVKRAESENDVVVTSIFVNPTQFNNPSDLLHYPRTIEKDKELLKNTSCDYLFLPEVSEMYPDGVEEKIPEINLGGLDTVMEGEHRPGHFAGVIQVVKKLFDCVGTCKAYFGEKDFQQLAVIRKMVKEWKLPVEIIPCPIVREKDGLAMSSRNTRLTEAERKIAPLISKSLFEAKALWKTHSADEVKKFVSEKINAEPAFRLEYFEIADADTLQKISPGQKSNAVGCIAVHLGAVRLIDNVLLEK